MGGFWGVFYTKVVRNHIPYNVAHNKISRRVNSLGVIVFDNFGVKISKSYIAMNLSKKTSNPNVKFHNNPYSRSYVNREQDLLGTHGNTQTYIQIDRNFVEGVLVHNFA